MEEQQQQQFLLDTSAASELIQTLCSMCMQTNHLDASAKAWLAGFLGRYSGTVVTVTHDEGEFSVCIAV
jgi:hypothetical protein